MLPKECWALFEIKQAVQLESYSSTILRSSLLVSSLMQPPVWTLSRRRGLRQIVIIDLFKNFNM